MQKRRDRKSFNKVLYHTFGKLDENVYGNKKGKKSFDESTLVCVCYINSYLFKSIEAWDLASR